MYLALVCVVYSSSPFFFSYSSFITRTLPLANCPPSVFSLNECVFVGQYQRWATIFAISLRRRRPNPFCVSSVLLVSGPIFCFPILPYLPSLPLYVTVTFTLTLLLWIFSHAISSKRMSHELTRPAGTEVLAMDTITWSARRIRLLLRKITHSL